MFCKIILEVKIKRKDSFNILIVRQIKKKEKAVFDSSKKKRLTLLHTYIPCLHVPYIVFFLFYLVMGYINKNFEELRTLLFLLYLETLPSDH